MQSSNGFDFLGQKNAAQPSSTGFLGENTNICYFTRPPVGELTFSYAQKRWELAQESVRFSEQRQKEAAAYSGVKQAENWKTPQEIRPFEKQEKENETPSAHTRGNLKIYKIYNSLHYTLYTAPASNKRDRPQPKGEGRILRALVFGVYPLLTQ